MERQTQVPMLHFHRPATTDKDWRMHLANDKRLNRFYEANPNGRMEILPSKYDTYEYYKINGRHKIVFQVVREGEDASTFKDGNYREYFVFYFCDKVVSSWVWPLHREWCVGYEVPIEMMETFFDTAFRNNWEFNDRQRIGEYREMAAVRSERDKFMVR